MLYFISAWGLVARFTVMGNLRAMMCGTGKYRSCAFLCLGFYEISKQKHAESGTYRQKVVLDMVKTCKLIVDLNRIDFERFENLICKLEELGVYKDGVIQYTPEHGPMIREIFDEVLLNIKTDNK